MLCLRLRRDRFLDRLFAHIPLANGFAAVERKPHGHGYARPRTSSVGWADKCGTVIAAVPSSGVVLLLPRKRSERWCRHAYENL